LLAFWPRKNARYNSEECEQALGRTTSGAVYEALRLLFDWLNTLFTLLPKVGRIEMAAKARKTSNRAYSTRSCPSSSRMNLMINSSIVCFLLLVDTSRSEVVAHSVKFIFVVVAGSADLPRRSLGHFIKADWLLGSAEFENPTWRRVVGFVTGAATLTRIDSIFVGMALATEPRNRFRFY